MVESIMERKVIYGGKMLIKAGEEHARAYIIQSGRVRAFIKDGDQEIDVAEYGPGRIIGEVCLMSDEPMTMSYQAMEDTTVATLTRAEFQKKISKMDKNVAEIIEHVMNKLNFQYAAEVDKALARSEMDEQALLLVRAMIAKVPDDRRMKYENAILPHLNAMLKELKAIKAEEKDNKKK